MKWNPVDYAKHSQAQLQWARTLKARLNLQGNEAILDVGCGDGKLTAEFATSIPHGKVVGVDSSESMIAYAQQHYPSSQYPTLTFRSQDARSLSFSDEFDVVFSNAVLHWVDDHPAFLRGAYDALKSGGQLVVSCGGAGNAADILQAFSEVISQSTWSSYFHKFQNPYFFFGPRQYSKWLDGFEIKTLKLVPKDMTHSGQAGLESWIRTTWMPFTEKVPFEQQDAFINEVVWQYIKQHPIDSQGQTHVKMIRLEVHALKPH